MFLAWMANAWVLWFVVSAALYLVRERRKKKARLRMRDLVVSPLAGLAMGAMFLGLQEIVQPQARHMIVEEMKETSVDDENGEPLGGRLFQEQLRRIRRGEDVEEVTVRMEEDALQ
jgi:hypothetical protein